MTAAMPAASHHLPPLILHPFANAASSLQMMESAKAAAQSVLGGAEQRSRAEELQEVILAGRYAEWCMLYFVGKDLVRWLTQCVDFGKRSASLREQGLVEQSFAEFLIAHTPPEVASKLRTWGVTDYPRIFARSIAIHIQFEQPPPRQWLATDFLRSYHRFADYAYECWKESVKFPALSAAEFRFDLYASGEYSKLLEQQWSG